MDTLNTLAENEEKKQRAKQDTIDTLKKAIVKKLVSEYGSYKENHPGSQKHPGIKITISVTDQVTQVV